MTPEAQRIAIATAGGHTAISDYGDGIVKGFPKGFPTPYNAYRCDVPDYPNDLNACEEMDKFLTEKQRIAWVEHMAEVLGLNNTEYDLDSSRWKYAHATAAQRCEAFLKCLGKWTP